MVAMFNFNRSDEQIFNDIVEGASESVRLYAEGKKDVKAYEELQADINSNIAKYLCAGSMYQAACEKEGSAILRNPNVTKKNFIRDKFDAVIAEIINTVVPTTTSWKFGDEFMDIRQIGWGDTARFLISSNELFQVNEIAEGIRRATLQPIFNDEVTVNCGPIEIATSIDWYQVAAGKFDWGNFGFRAGRSFEGYIMLKAIAAFLSAAPDNTSPYAGAGFDTDQWTTLAERISSANGGSDVYALGTLSALAKIHPEAAPLQYALGANGVGDELLKDGHLDRYLGVKLIPIDNFILPGMVNTTATLGVPQNLIIMVAADAYKPVKVVFEGSSVAVEWDPKETTDKTYRIGVQMRIGVAAIVGSYAGYITLPKA